MAQSPEEFMRFTAPDPEALEQAIRLAQRKLEEAKALGDEIATLEQAADLGGMLTTARREGSALELLVPHKSLATLHQSKEQSAWYWNALATALQYFGERATAEAYFAKAVEVAKEGGWRRIEAMTLHHWGRSLVEQGQVDAAELRFAQALVIREELNEPRQETSREALKELARMREARDA
jgi:tetratricopeptide (TPR) repeat protein